MNTNITILCIDDEMDILTSLKRCLRPLGANVVFANSGFDALEILNTQPVDIVVSDMRMPKMDGVELLSTVFEQWPNIYRILLTGYADMDSLKGAVNFGKIHCYVEKPWDNNALISQLELAISSVQEQKQQHETQDLVDKQNKTLQAHKTKLQQRVALRTKQVKRMLNKNQRHTDDIYSVLHNFVEVHPSLDQHFSYHVCKTAVVLARALDFTSQEIKDIQVAGELCQIGMMGLKSDFSKIPYEKLTYNQQLEYFSQVDFVHGLLAPAEALLNVEAIVMNQFEQIDGRGYPSKIQRAEIPKGSLVLAIARDFWRCKLGKMKALKMSDFESFNELQKYRGSRYDSELLNIFYTLLHKKQNNPITHNVDVASLKPGMTLRDNLFGRKHMLLLRKGHVITAKCIEKLKRLEDFRQKRFILDVNFPES